MTPAERRLFTAELRAGRASALRRLRRELRAAGGSPKKAAQALGVGVQTLYDARSAQPLVKAVWDACVTPQAEAARRGQLVRHHGENATIPRVRKKKSKIDRDPLRNGTGGRNTIQREDETMKAAAIQWDNGARTPVGDLDATRCAGLVATKVIWTDGSWSWAKSWCHPWDGERHPLARIGAGAFGTLTVWQS